MLSLDNRSTKLPPTYLAGISVDFIHDTSQFTRWEHRYHYIDGKLLKKHSSQRKCSNDDMVSAWRMLIVCHLSYQDCEAIVYMKHNFINTTEQQYNHNATETLIIDN